MWWLQIYSFLMDLFHKNYQESNPSGKIILGIYNKIILGTYILPNQLNYLVSNSSNKLCNTVNQPNSCISSNFMSNNYSCSCKVPCTSATIIASYVSFPCLYAEEYLRIGQHTKLFTLCNLHCTEDTWSTVPGHFSNMPAASATEKSTSKIHTIHV